MYCDSTLSEALQITIFLDIATLSVRDHGEIYRNSKDPERQLRYIVSACEPSQKIKTKPKQHCVTKVAINNWYKVEVYVDFMYIEGAYVLQAVDKANHVTVTQFSHPLTADSVSETIITLWENACTGLPDTLVFDDGSQLGENFVEIYEIDDAEW